MAMTLPAGAASASTANALAADARSLNQLKFEAGQNSAQAARETAKQFESLFMREMIKSMREATMKSGLLDNAQGDLGTDLLDQQLSVQMSGQQGGLSEAIARQLSRQMGGADATLSAPSTLSLSGANLSASALRSSSAATRTAAPANANANANAVAPKGRDDFVQHHALARIAGGVDVGNVVAGGLQGGLVGLQGAGADVQKAHGGTESR